MWVVRKWLKGNESGILGGVNVGINAVMKGMRGLGVSERGGSIGSGSISEPGEGVEVRFEWIRGTPKHLKRSSIQPPNRRASVHVPPESHLSAHSPELSQTAERRLSAIRPGTADSKRAPSPVAPRTREGGVHVTVLHPSEHDRDHESFTNSVESEDNTWDGHGAGPSAHTTSMRDKRASQAGTSTRGSHSREDDDGDESDPEDSETPWSCCLTIHSVRGKVDIEKERERELLAASLHSSSRAKSHSSAPPLITRASGSSGATQSTLHTPPGSQTHPARTSTSSSSPPPPAPLLRLKIATLSPAPHHPKVVAQLKVPFPLPDVEIDRARARKRIIGPNGIPMVRAPSGYGREDDRDEEDDVGNVMRRGSSGLGRYEGLMLTAEEIKDVLSSTAFWVVVREGLGGVGKVNRKGDGWRIRG